MFPQMKSVLGRAALEEITEAATEIPAEENPTDAAPAEGGGETAPQTPPENNEVAPDATAPAETGGEQPPEGGEGGGAEGEQAPEAGGEAGEGGQTEGQQADAQAAADTEAKADDVEAATEPEIGAEVEGGESANAIADEMADVDAVAEKAEGASEDLEKLQSATEELSSTVDILQASLQRGGLDPYGSMLLRRNLRMALESIDQDQNSILLPALEDAETPSSRMGMVGDAIDAIKKFLARIGKAIADGFKKFTAWLGEIMAKLTSAFAGLKARATRLKEMAKGAEMTDQIVSKGVLKSFVFGNTLTKDFFKASQEYCDAAKVLADASTYEGYLSALGAMEKGVKDNKTSEEIEVAVNAELTKLYESVSKVSKRYLILFGEHQYRGSAQREMDSARMVLSGPGNRVNVLWIPTSLKDIGALGATTARLESVAPPSAVPALDEKQAIALCDKIIETCDWFQSSASATKQSAARFSEEVKKQSDAIMVHVNAAIETRDTDKGPVQATMARSVGSWVSRMGYSLPKLPCYAVSRSAPGAMGDILDVVAASIKKAGGAEKASSSKQVATV